MAALQFTPIVVPTGEPISTAVASTFATLGASFLRGSQTARSKKEAARQADLQRQTQAVLDTGSSFAQQISQLDAGAPELAGFVSFVNRKIDESPGPGDQRADVEHEGRRILGVVTARRSQAPVIPRSQAPVIPPQTTFAGAVSSSSDLGQQFSRTIEELKASVQTTLTQRDLELQQGILSGLSSIRGEVGSAFDATQAQTQSQLGMIQQQARAAEQQATRALALAQQPPAEPAISPRLILGLFGAVLLVIVLVKRK